MTRREEKRNLETIPVGSLGIIPLEGCKSLGEKVDYYLVKRIPLHSPVIREIAIY